MADSRYLILDTCHCEERSDVAISLSVIPAKAEIYALFVILSEREESLLQIINNHSSIIN